jgi:hypothetical protein
MSKMKMSRIAAIGGLFVAALGLGTAAEARPDGPRWDNGRHYGRQYDRGHHYGHDRGYGYDRGNYRRGPRYGFNGPRHRCWTEWRHHHRVRVCR